MNMSRAAGVAALLIALSNSGLALAGGGHAANPAPTPTKPVTAKPASKKDAPAAEPVKEAAAPKQAVEEKAPAKPQPSHTDASSEAPTAKQSLAWLTEGNTRFVESKAENPNTDSARISEVASGQHPFATILTCADSRIPVERVFDRGVGDLFVIRVAGNVAGESETGTIEYGAGHLHTPLLVVMGHTACGAVNAAAANADLHGAVAKLVGRIKPAVDQARSQYPELKPEQIAPIAVRLNVWQSVGNLISGSEEIRGLVSDGKLEVVGAIYDLNTGRVHFLGSHPSQADLLKSNPAATAEASPKAEANDAHADAEPASEKSH